MMHLTGDNQCGRRVEYVCCRSKRLLSLDVQVTILLEAVALAKRFIGLYDTTVTGYTNMAFSFQNPHISTSPLLA